MFSVLFQAAARKHGKSGEGKKVGREKMSMREMKKRERKEG